MFGYKPLFWQAQVLLHVIGYYLSCMASTTVFIIRIWLWLRWLCTVTHRIVTHCWGWVQNASRNVDKIKQNHPWLAKENVLHHLQSALIALKPSRFWHAALTIHTLSLSHISGVIIELNTEHFKYSLCLFLVKTLLHCFNVRLWLWKSLCILLCFSVSQNFKRPPCGVASAPPRLHLWLRGTHRGVLGSPGITFHWQKEISVVPKSQTFFFLICLHSNPF